MLLLHWWGFTLLCSGPAQGHPSTTVENYSIVTDIHTAVKSKWKKTSSLWVSVNIAREVQDIFIEEAVVFNMTRTLVIIETQTLLQ